MNNLTHFQIGNTYHSTLGPIQIIGKSFIKPNHWNKNFTDLLDTVYYKYKHLNGKKDDYFSSRSGLADSLLLIKSNNNLIFKTYI